jgi:menaquinone-9 beta-reductase
MSARRVDAVVIGGGLAGCAAAIGLARQGWDVALFEARRYPHDKVCGEFLSPECRAMLDDLGVMPGLERLCPPLLETVRITVPDGFTWIGRMPGAGIGLSRAALDGALAERVRATGGVLYEGATVNQVEGSLDEGFSLAYRRDGGEARISARAVIAAHGKRSQVDRVLERPFLRRRQPFVALKAYFRGPPMPNRVDVHAFPGGYCGIAEVEGDRSNVCLLAREDAFRRAAGGPPGDIAAFVAWMRRQNRYLDDWLAGATRISERWLTIAEVSFAAKAAVERDVLMAGDAAGLIAPLAGDGMAMALDAGRLAAHWSDGFLRGDVTAGGLRRGYAAGWQRRYRSRLSLGRFLQFWLLRPGLLGPGLRVLGAVPGLGQYFVDHTRDRRHGPIYSR